jgi:CRP/FNR family transcriptional regulator
MQKEMLVAAKEAQLPESAYYFQEGDMCDQFAVVGSGSLRVYKVAESGREITLYHVHAGESCLLNMSCLLSNKPCPATARAETAVEALLFSSETFRRWVNTNEAVSSYFFAMIAERMSGVMALVEEVAFRRLDERLAEYLLTQGPETQDGVLHITHAEIAAELGSAREVISRLLKDFERVGAIKISRGTIQLRDRPQIQLLARTR